MNNFINAQMLWHIFLGSSIGVAILQYLKKAPWFTIVQVDGTRVANRIAAAVIALMSASGIHYAWDPTAHTLTLMDLNFWGIINSLWHWAQQFIAQETVYQMTAKKAGETNIDMSSRSDRTTINVAPVGTTGTVEPAKLGA